MAESDRKPSRSRAIRAVERELKARGWVRTRVSTPLGDRLLAAMHYAGGLSQAELQRVLWSDDPHQGRGRLSRYISGQRGQHTIDPLLFQRMADVLGVDYTWLTTGRGEMVPPGSSAKVTDIRPRRGK